MPNVLRVFVFVFITAVGLPVQVSADQAHHKLDQFLAAIDADERAMLSISVRQAGEQIYSGSIGFADVAAAKPNTQDTVFRVGSISKTYTAVLVLQLAAEGKLALSDPLSKYFDQFPSAEKITLRHLLSHRSGLYNITDAPEYPDYMTQAQSQSKMLGRMSASSAQFEPGARYAYSNTNYLLLGYILERVTGSTYAKLLEQRITKPLGLENTAYGSALAESDRSAKSYQWQGAWKLAPETNMSVPHASGAVAATAGDVSKFYHALFAGQLVDPYALADMISTRENYGLGLVRMPFYSRWMYGHNGGIDGFQSSGACDFGSQTCVVVLANGVNLGFNDLMIGVLSIVFGEPYEIADFAKPATAAATAPLDRYEGEYTSDDLPLDIRVFLDDGALFAQATGQGAFPLQATTGHEFVFPASGITMRFVVEGSTVEGFILLQGGGRFAYVRKGG